VFFLLSPERRQEVAPGVDVPARVDDDLADQVLVEEGGELADRGLGPRERPIVEPQRVGHHRDLERRAERWRTPRGWGPAPRGWPSSWAAQSVRAWSRWRDGRPDRASPRAPPPCT